MEDLSSEVLLQNWGVDAQWLGAVLRSAPLGAIVFDEKCERSLVNREARALLGIAEAPENFLEALGESRVVRSDLLRRYVSVAMHGPNGPSVHVSEGPDGKIRCLEFRVSALSENAFLCWVRDVTELQELKQYRLFTEIGRIRAGKSTTQALARRLVDAILEFLNVDIAVLTLYERKMFRPIAARGILLEPGDVLDPAIHHYLREAIETRKPVSADGSEWEPGAPAELTGSHYIVPLLASGEIVGTLHLGSLDSLQLLQTPDFDGSTPRYTFDTVDAAFLETLSGYAGAAIANVRLFEENQEERATLRTVVESIPEGIVVYNARGEIEIANTAANRIAGVEWTNVNTDSRPYRLRDADGQPLNRSEWPFFRAVRSGCAVMQEIVIADFGEFERHLEVSVVPVPSPDANATSYVGTLQDVTDRRSQQRRREELISIASHELRGPLTPLVGFLQMMRKQVEEGESLDPALLGRAEHQVSRLSRLIDTLLDVTRIESGKMELNRELVDLRDVLARTVDLWRAHPRRLEIDLTVPRHAIIASIDSDRMEQVFANVVDNAVKHSHDGGRIEVTLLEQDGCAVAEVRDFGGGIPAEVLPKVFERFFSMRERRGGMGLGLYITREIVERHGGKIEISSVEGESTCVRIALPLEPH